MLNQWRDGAGGALVMALLFVAGVMNLVWVAAIALFVLVEKLVPLAAVSWGTGVGLVASGVWLLSRGL